MRELIARAACDVFLDLKFHDIPNTVAGGVRNAAALGARLVTVHAAGGRAMLDGGGRGDRGDRVWRAGGDGADVAAAERRRGRVGAAETRSIVSAEVDAAGDAGRRRRARTGSCAAGARRRCVRERFGDRLAILVPGVRAAGGPTQDQARVVTPREAAEAGARYIDGRPDGDGGARIGGRRWSGCSRSSRRRGEGSWSSRIDVNRPPCLKLRP